MIEVVGITFCFIGLGFQIKEKKQHKLGQVVELKHLILFMGGVGQEFRTRTYTEGVGSDRRRRTRGRGGVKKNGNFCGRNLWTATQN